jgi:hypothetical protein
MRAASESTAEVASRNGSASAAPRPLDIIARKGAEAAEAARLTDDAPRANSRAAATPPERAADLIEARSVEKALAKPMSEPARLIVLPNPSTNLAAARRSPASCSELADRMIERSSTACFGISDLDE